MKKIVAGTINRAFAARRRVNSLSFATMSQSLFGWGMTSDHTLSNRMRFILLLLAAVAFAQTPRYEIGVQVAVLDKRKGIGEKPGMAGGRATVKAYRFVDVDFEVNRFPIGGAQSSFPGT